jgi:hypothetical protein
VFACTVLPFPPLFESPSKCPTISSYSRSAYPYAIEAQSKYFVEEILGHRSAPLSSMQDAIVCQKIIEASERSMAERRHVDLQEI